MRGKRGVLLVLLLATTACRPAPRVVVVVPLIEWHSLDGWPEDDEVCVEVTTWGNAGYSHRRCLSVRAIRALIVASQLADDQR